MGLLGLVQALHRLIHQIGRKRPALRHPLVEQQRHVVGEVGGFEGTSGGGKRPRAHSFHSLDEIRVIGRRRIGRSRRLRLLLEQTACQRNSDENGDCNEDSA